MKSQANPLNKKLFGKNPIPKVDDVDPKSMREEDN